MRRWYWMGMIILMGMMVSQGVAQKAANLVTSHRTNVAESGYTQIDFTLRRIPEEALLSFSVRFEPRFV